MIPKQFYVIRHKHSGHLFPDWICSSDFKNIGWNPSPTDKDNQVPDLFLSESQAEWALVKFLSLVDTLRFADFEFLKIQISQA